MGDACILGSVDKFHISFFIICFEGLETLLGNALDTLLLFAFGMGVERQDGFTEADDTVRCSAVHGRNFSAMSADDAELFNMLLLRATLALNALLAVKALGA